MKMRSIRIHSHGGPEQLVLEEIERPEPQPGQALVRLYACGINPLDTYYREGSQGFSCMTPYVPGDDGAGIIEIAEDIHHAFKPGDRVYCCGSLSGTYAEYCLCSLDQLYHLPESISFAQGACLGIPYTTAYLALFEQGRFRAGDKLLIHGASGGVGTAALQLAAAAGISVCGSAGSKPGCDLILDQGGQLALNHTDKEHMRVLMDWSEQQGVDGIIEMLANENLDLDLQLLAKNGQVVVVGCRGTIEINPRDLMKRNATITGLALANTGHHDRQRIHQAIGAGLRSGALKPVIGNIHALAEASIAHKELLKKSAKGNLVLTP